MTEDELLEQLSECDNRRREARMLLVRMVKAVREESVIIPVTTRIVRLTAQVDDYLKRTHDPNDILRGEL